MKKLGRPPTGKPRGKMVWIDGRFAGEVESIKKENARLIGICQMAHDRLLRGDDDLDILFILSGACDR